MYIANEKQFRSYDGLENWCIDNGLYIEQIQQTDGVNLVTVAELDKHEAAINRQRKADIRVRERQEIYNRNYNW
jgi:hypothetical protein